MSLDKNIIIIMAVFSFLGGLDRILGNRFGLGEAFERGILTIGQLALSMIGIIVLCPVLADLLNPFVVPVYQFFGADPAMFAGSFFACDMGGASLAAELAESEAAANLGGIIAASMLGVTVSFTIPVAMSTLSKSDRPYAAKGILCGVITIPVGILAGGLMAGCSMEMVLKNSIPIALMAILIALGLWKAEKQLIKGFEILGKILAGLATVGLVAGGIELTTGFTLIPGLGSMEEAFIIVCQIGIVLSGAIPLMNVITRALNKPIAQISRVLKVNITSVSGLIATLANSIAAFDMIKDMDNRGKIVNMAFAVSGAFVFGDHLAFTAGVDSAMIPALIAGKLSAGITAVLVAVLITREKKNKKQ